MMKNLYIFILIVIQLFQKTFTTFNQTGNFTFSLEDEPSTFGAIIDNQIQGYLSLSIPLNACMPILPPKDSSKKHIALAIRGNCTFVTKVMNAQKHYIALILYDNKDEPLTPMTGDGDDVNIPSIIISLKSGMLLLKNNAIGNFTVIKPNGTNYLLPYLIPFILFLIIILLGLTIFLVYRIVINYKASRKLALSRSQLSKLKKITFKKSQFNFETCAICIEDYVNGEKLRILPCNHAYHCKCIDKWLLKRRRVCPICKHVIRFPGEKIDSDIEREASNRITNQESDHEGRASSVSGDILPPVVISNFRRKCRTHFQPSDSQQASTSLEQQEDEESGHYTDTTSEDGESTETKRSSLNFLSRIKNTMKVNINPENAISPTKRLFKKRKAQQDHESLVHSSNSSASSSGKSTPQNLRSSFENQGHSNEGFVIGINEMSESEKATSSSQNGNEII